MDKLKKFGAILLNLFGIVMGCVWTYNGVAPIMGPIVVIMFTFLVYMVATDKIKPYD
jgi:hypothetical protein